MQQLLQAKPLMLWKTEQENKLLRYNLTLDQQVVKSICFKYLKVQI